MKVWCENPYDYVLFDTWEHVEHPSEADVIVFSGGSDVSPYMYGQEPLAKTNYDSRRDQTNHLDFLTPNTIAIGICRGAQFLNVMNGGTLFQDVTNHGRNHSIHISDGRSFMVNSTHHQMMDNLGGGELIGWAEGLSDYYQTDSNLNTVPLLFEPEIVKWPATKSIGFQYHPEWMDKGAPARMLFDELVNNFVEEMR